MSVNLQPAVDGGFAAAAVRLMGEFAGRTFDGAISRLAHGAAAARSPAPSSAQDEAVLHRAERDLAAGRLLHQWWLTKGPAGHFGRRFELERAFNRPDEAFGFFDEIRTATGTLPIMGVVQEMFYDRSKEAGSTGWIRRQLREFVFRYFLRVSSFRDPAPYATVSGAPPEAPECVLSWCPKPRTPRHGFGFSQHFARLRDSGRVVRFPEEDRYEIADQRELGRAYDWILSRVGIYDFALSFRPFGPPWPEFVFNIDEESYLMMAPDFVRDVERPEPGVAAEYGIGYAYVKNPAPGLVAYGPGEFDAAFKQITFRVLDDGGIRVRMVFISNRPTGVLSIRFDPLAAGFRAADLLSLGLSSSVFSALERAARAVPGMPCSFDPVYTYIDLIDALTAGRANRDWCISREQLDFDFLLQHVRVHYRALAGTVVTWRLIPDWLDNARLPDWVIRGVSA